jgi:hypothetical protein
MSNLTVPLAALAVTVSSLVRPTGRATLLEDVQANIKTFSPYQSAAIVLGQAIDLINWRLTNIAEIHASLWALAGVQFYVPETQSMTSELSHGVLVTLARRIFLVGVALPFYLFLVMSSCHWIIKWSTTFLLAEAAMIELSACYLKVSCSGVVFHTDWPQHPIVGKRFFASGPCPGNHMQEPIERTTIHSNNENGNDHGQHTAGENLCDRVRHIWSPDTRPNKELPVGRHPMENIPNIAHITSPTGPVLVSWTCGHWRCLLYMLLRLPVKALFYSVVIFDFALAAWFLHDNMQTVSIPISRFLLAKRLLNDLLTFTFLCAVLIVVGFTIYLVLVVLVPRIFRAFGFFQPMRRFRDIIHDLPSSVKGVGRYGVFCISIFMSWNVARLLMKRDPILTDSILSYIIELLVMPQVTLSIYRRIFVPPNSGDQMQDAKQPHYASEFVPSDLPSTGKVDESEQCSDDKIKQEAREKRLISSWTTFRLAILLPNAAIWIFRRSTSTA